MSSCHLLLGRPLDLFPLLGCHAVHRLVHLLSFNLPIWPAHFHFCFSVYSMISMIFVLFLISAHGILSFLCKGLKYLKNALDVFKYLRNGFTMLKMISEFDKRLKCMGNDVCMWEIAYIFEKRLKYVWNDLDMWEMVQIYGKWLKYLTNGLNMWELT